MIKFRGNFGGYSPCRRTTLTLFLCSTYKLSINKKICTMKYYVLFTIIISALMLSLSACGEETSVVESGTYNGTIAEINEDETEIYVDLESGERIELYFTDETTLTQDGEDVPFSTIQVDDRVEVTIEKTGQRLDPVSVVLLD